MKPALLFGADPAEFLLSGITTSGCQLCYFYMTGLPCREKRRFGEPDSADRLFPLSKNNARAAYLSNIGMRGSAPRFLHSLRNI